MTSHLPRKLVGGRCNLAGIKIPRPPRWAERANTVPSTSLGG